MQADVHLNLSAVLLAVSRLLMMPPATCRYRRRAIFGRPLESFGKDANSRRPGNMPGGNRTMKKSLFIIPCFAAAMLAVPAHAQVPAVAPSVTYEDGPDGVRYQITRSVVQRSIPTTEYQAREQKVYRPQVTTE